MKPSPSASPQRPDEPAAPAGSIATDRVLRMLHEVSHALSAQLEIDSLCCLIVHKLAAVLQSEICALLFVDELRGVLTVRCAVGMTDDAVAAFVAPVDAGLFGDVIAGRSPFLTLTPDERIASEAASHREGGPFGPDPGATIIAPLVADRRVQGVIVLSRSRTSSPFAGSQHQLIELLCAHIAQAIDNAWLYGRLRGLNTALEAKVAERTAELDAKAKVLERALRDLKDMQVQYLQREKMASLGQLTAGIAHEINNPLAYATSNVSLARERLMQAALVPVLMQARAALGADLAPELAWERLAPALERLRTSPVAAFDTADFLSDAEGQSPDARIRLAGRFVDFMIERLRPPPDALQHLESVLDRAAEGLQRVKQIVLDLRTFSRLDEAECQLADLDKSIEATLSLTRHLAKETSVRIEFVPGMTERYPCRVSQLNQVVMNLVVNAIQASGEGQPVVVSTRDEPQGVTIEVLDHGSGIAPADVSRIFDPFFTTKAPGEGIGLGLSLCYRIVSDHGGRIDVASEPGKGTCFRVRLPRRTREETGACSHER